MGANKQSADWKNGFLFVGNHLVLDFLNTCPVQNREARELLPDFSAVVRWFKAADLLTSKQAADLQRRWGRSARARRALEALRKLRERLREEVLRWEDGSDLYGSTVDELNQLMAKHPMLMRLETRGNVLKTKSWFVARAPEDLFAPLAYGAATLFANADRTRVRRCGSCVLHFLDTSKKGTRRWCSMQLCGNRLKVAAYAARQRQQSSQRSKAT